MATRSGVQGRGKKGGKRRKISLFNAAGLERGGAGRSGAKPRAWNGRSLANLLQESTRRVLLRDLMLVALL